MQLAVYSIHQWYTLRPTVTAPLAGIEPTPCATRELGQEVVAFWLPYI